MKRKNWTQLAILASALGFGVSADTIWTGATDLDFGTVGNWTNGSPGNTNGIARINNGNTVSLSSNYSAANPYTLEVDGNSTLNASADFTSTRLTIRSGSTVNLTGGAYTLPKTSVSNNGGGLSLGGTLEISGGSHQINERTFMTGTFRVVGSSPTIRMNQIGNANGAIFDFVFDSGGVSGITGDLGFSWLSIGGSSITVDGSAFNGTGSFTLIDSNNYGSMPTAGQISVSGLGVEGIGWNLQIVDDVGGGTERDTIVLNVIPEPGFAGLMGLGLAMALLLRRRG